MLNSAQQNIKFKKSQEKQSDVFEIWNRTMFAWFNDLRILVSSKIWNISSSILSSSQQTANLQNSSVTSSDIAHSQVSYAMSSSQQTTSQSTLDLQEKREEDRDYIKIPPYSVLEGLFNELRAFDKGEIRELPIFTDDIQLLYDGRVYLKAHLSRSDCFRITLGDVLWSSIMRMEESEDLINGKFQLAWYCYASMANDSFLSKYLSMSSVILLYNQIVEGEGWTGKKNSF